ncbi:MAG: hypothetical protein PHI98_10815 [Eubacteriales bacterium]|nr:hypothetical protein [Eubacteriales bacterium]
MRVGKILLTVAFAGLFLLLLSALVVSPETEISGEEAALVGARLLPVALPSQDLGTLLNVQHAEPLRALTVLFTLSFLPLLTSKRDANGRVLQSKRYENSFYQLFRQEVAGG